MAVLYIAVYIVTVSSLSQLKSTRSRVTKFMINEHKVANRCYRICQMLASKGINFSGSDMGAILANARATLGEGNHPRHSVIKNVTSALLSRSSSSSSKFKVVIVSSKSKERIRLLEKLSNQYFSLCHLEGRGEVTRLYDWLRRFSEHTEQQ